MVVVTKTRPHDLLAPVFLPWFWLTFGLGILSLALPLYLVDSGLSFTRSAVVLAGVGVGAAVSGIFVGDGVSRWGERSTRAVALVAGVISVVLLGLTDNVVALFALQFATGVASIGVRLAAQSTVRRTVESANRGRLLAGFGGTRRLGVFVGPVVGGVLVDGIGFAPTFVVAGLAMALGLPPALARRRASVDDLVTAPRVRLSESLARFGPQVLRIGIGPSLVMTVRTGRSVVLPLIGDQIGLSPTEVGLMVGVSTGADLALFPVSGYVMDRFGRLVAIVPAFTLMALGLLLLGFAETGPSVVAAGAIIGIGNGLSSGSLMTIASDLAPDDSPAPFMALFGALQDWGQVLGPLVVGWTADAIGLGASAIALAIAMLVGLVLVVVTIGETGEPRTWEKSPKT